MRRDSPLAILLEFKRDYAEKYGILEIGIFGSMGRIEAREDSDVDRRFYAKLWIPGKRNTS